MYVQKFYVHTQSDSFIEIYLFKLTFLRKTGGFEKH